MKIEEVHNMFRTYAQQMGMQTIRAILPESIDDYLNHSIVNKVRSIVLDNATTVYNDKVTQQRNPISPLNGVRTLYSKYYTESIKGNGTIGDPYTIEADIDDNVMFYTKVALQYKDNKYGCRFINNDDLEDTLNDYCSRASSDAPIAVISYDEHNKIKLDVITEDSTSLPVGIEIRYIRKPAKVKYSEVPEECVDPDIPEHLIPDIVDMAVRDYFNSVGSTSGQ